MSSSNDALAVNGSSEILDRAHRRRLRGWLCYAFASEVFAVVSLTLFLPICLEQFARDNGYLSPDYTIPCVDQTTKADEGTRCAVRLGWAWIDTASFSLYVFSASVALQALTVISVGAIADTPSQRKPLLLAFAAIGSLSTSAFLPLTSTSPIWIACALFAILGNVSFGTSIVAMNAYLPDLAKGSPEVRKAWDEVEVANETYLESQPLPPAASDSEVDLPSAPLIVPPPFNSVVDIDRVPAHKAAVAHYNRLLSRTTSRLSSQGIALGYGAGIVLLLCTLVPVTMMKGSTFSLRLAIGLSGIWWAVFSIPAAFWLPTGRGGPVDVAKEGEHVSLWVEIKRSWSRIIQMFRPTEIRKLRNTFWYLAAWFLLSDGFTTITSTAVLFAKTTLHLPATALVIVGVLTPMAGIVGSLIWPRIQRYAGWTNIRVVYTLVVLASLIPLYGCLGFLSVFQGDGTTPGKFRFGGLTTKGEMFALAIYFGSIFGAFQAYARAVYSEIIPRGEEARWFSLYSITDKSSSFVGPLGVGLIADLTGNIRYGFFFIVVMMWISLPVLFTVDVDRGREDAKAVSDERERAARELDL
ncbi:MFS general substrate transporter [Exidia glandulosa HHB12029]|uniref:Autophagy-related protein n=1 Tax=Exidia glandulosa HHB12029 TaxID=1314781 RepID=A0A165M7U1_EXIGL|nr:MFS general substrate transporter [Exidia glandulosa HHB12029]